jgi:hypothetical protein
MTHSDFFSGMIAAGFLVCALFFVRFWTKTRDGLFAAFSLAFLLLAASQTLTVFLGLPQEEYSWIFVLRLMAFLLLIAAILRKNLGR